MTLSLLPHEETESLAALRCTKTDLPTLVMNDCEHC